MKLFLPILIVVFSVTSSAQSGRRHKPSAASAPTPEQNVAVPLPTPSMPSMAPVTAEKNHEYRCTTDGSLAEIIDINDSGGPTYLPKEVDTKAVIKQMPEPKYTREARRYGIQGNVVLKVLLGSKGEISRVKVVRVVPLGLTENAIRAACEIKFDPATKNGAQVSQWATLEYPFRLARSSIFGP